MYPSGVGGCIRSERGGAQKLINASTPTALSTKPDLYSIYTKGYEWGLLWNIIMNISLLKIPNFPVKLYNDVYTYFTMGWGSTDIGFQRHIANMFGLELIIDYDYDIWLYPPKFGELGYHL